MDQGWHRSHPGGAGRILYGYLPGGLKCVYDSALARPPPRCLDIYLWHTLKKVYYICMRTAH